VEYLQQCCFLWNSNLHPITDIFIVEYLQQCKIKFEPPKHKREIAQCANCQRYGHSKNYCHLKSRCVKCAGDHTPVTERTDQKMSNVSSVAATIQLITKVVRYTKSSNKNLPIPPTQTISSSGSSHTNPSHLPRSIICSSRRKLHTYHYIHKPSTPPFPTPSTNLRYP
jgi:hypothetical protein